MRLLQICVQSNLAAAAGWTLLHSLWQGAIVSAVLAAALFAIRSARIRYAAACAALLAMLGGFILTLALEMPQGWHVSPAGPASAFPAWRFTSFTGASSPWESSLSALAPWLAPFWIAGVSIFYLRHVAGFMSIHRLRRRGVCSPPETWRVELARLSAKLGLTRPVLLLESCLAEAPLVLGHFRPLILMPIGLLASVPVGQIEAILLHELAHIRRHDYLVNVVQGLLEGLFFYHPAAWWISKTIRTEREYCCDDLVVSISGDAHQYAVALTALEENRWPGREPALAATGGSLVKRIRRLLYPNRPNGAWTPFIAAAILIAVTAITLAGWQSEPPAKPHSPEVYSNWLNQDVVYIIEDAERAAFQRLTTDDERDMFIEQFWQRRDPKFKAEHYRRIAYSNQHYATQSGAPGWQTDRGHMYIVYGPADELESHPKPGQGLYAYETWLYRHLEGIGNFVSITFIDRAGGGDYRFAPGNTH